MTGAEYVATDLGLKVATTDFESLGVARKVRPTKKTAAYVRVLEEGVSRVRKGGGERFGHLNSSSGCMFL
eukprot:463072-Pyramimonas_sp.AAC.1